MKFKFTFLSFVAGAIGLSGCGIVHDHYEYELESPSDTTEIRHYKSICVNQRNGAACYYVYDNGEYLSEELKEKYLRLSCDLGYKKACDELTVNLRFVRKCVEKNDFDSCEKTISSLYNSNRNEVLSFLEKECDVNHQGKYCSYLSKRFYNQKKAAINDYDISLYFNKSYDYAEKGCNLDDFDSCTKLGSLFVEKYKNDYKKMNKDERAYLVGEWNKIINKACNVAENKDTIYCWGTEFVVPRFHD